MEPDWGDYQWILTASENNLTALQDFLHPGLASHLIDPKEILRPSQALSLSLQEKSRPADKHSHGLDS
jgi:hypothetical protein